MAKITLSVEPRTITGKKVEQLRKQGVIPANIFGGKIKSAAIQVKKTVFAPVWQHAGETQIVYLQLGDEKEARPTLISNVQHNPVSDEVIHVDFRQVDLKEKITANIPVEVFGESPAVKDFQAAIITSLGQIEVEALPTDLPENIQVDISLLKNIGDVIKVADLKIDRTKVEVKDDPETVVVSAAAQQAEEVIAPPPAPEAEAVEGAPAEAPAPEAETKAPAPTPKKEESTK
ncbi:MAG: 50S ribosomal protein L25 [Patescibacteria group bacterium]